MTGSQNACSATARDVFFNMTGSDSHTNKISLGLLQRLTASSSFHQDTYDDMIIESDQHLGDIQVVGVGLDYDIIAKVEDAILDCHWYVDYISIFDLKDGSETQFPCNHWLGYNSKEVTVVSKVGRCTYVHMLMHEQ